MRRVALIYNPMSGQHSERRAEAIADVVAVLRGAGIEVETIATESPQSAAAQAQEAVRAGCDTVLACGGDGTAHEVLQHLVGGQAALGVIPMGTANALATDLGLPASPVEAVKMLLEATPVRVGVGHLFYCDIEGEPRSRYFIVAAGVGADAFFFSRLDSRLKRRFGYLLYLVEAIRVWATYRFPMFSASFMEDESGTPRAVEASQLLAVRIGNFGGLVNHLVPGASLGSNRLRAIVFKTNSRMRYMGFIVAAIFGRQTYTRTIEMVKCVSLECRTVDGPASRLFVEADGELLGTLPVRIEAVPQALTLLVPAKALGRIARV